MISAPFWFARNFFLLLPFITALYVFRDFDVIDQSLPEQAGAELGHAQLEWLFWVSSVWTDFLNFLVQVADQPGWIWFPGSVTICCSMIALYGSMALWFYGSMVLWFYGWSMIALWLHYGSMALWFYGSMVLWLKYDCTMIALWLYYDCTMIALWLNYALWFPDLVTLGLIALVLRLVTGFPLL